ncbi:cytochrome P450 [Cryphonectria parasitica EP155]|uniref:Cytochrome P450 n=1 Tax=Cryphonectria parasitica (strain ATCC 38755 / EP155) TaxID=660469 RepID=A0A9P5CPE7_CRYP1|nr:cytochrome P450 [Cryphonectria parasitica EP155]KAF3766399.1 cytochrome P450 [Cryphonectria parasitica EP155]
MDSHNILTTFWYIVGAWWLLFATAIALFIHQWIRVEHHPLSRLPGTWISKWSNIPAWIELVKGRQPVYIHSLFEKYGPVVRIGPNQVCFCDMASLNQIYNVEEKFVKSYLHEAFVGSPAPNVFSTAEVEVHRRHRKLLEPVLSESAVAQLYPSVKSKIDLAIQRIGEETRREGSSDIYKWWTLTAADVSGELTLGQSLGILENGKKDEFIEELQDGSILTLARVILPFIIPIAEYISLGPVTRACTARKKTYQRSQEILFKHRDAAKADPSSLPPSLFARFLAEQDQENLDPLEVVSNAVTFLANGTDTTAGTLTYLVWSVCRHPEVRVQLSEELDELPEGFDDRHLRRLTYLNQVIEETLRLYPAVAGGLLRTTPPEGAQIGGYWIPGGTTVSCQAYSMHRDPKIFPNPFVFYPERWTEPSTEMRMAMMAWGGGARTCLGIHLARMELRLGAALFFRAFPQARISDTAGMADGDMEPEMISFTTPRGHKCLMECK